MSNIIFMGTPKLAETVLARLIASGTHKPKLVITQQDKPVGRKQIMTPSPVKTFAQEHGIEVWQPATLKDLAAIEKIRAHKPDCIVVAAYGKIIPKMIIDIPSRGIVNVHTSLLPRWRGESHIQHALLAGDNKNSGRAGQYEGDPCAYFAQTRRGDKTGARRRNHRAHGAGAQPLARSRS